jgi:hypothetical protein
MIERVAFAIFSLCGLAALATGLYQTTKWLRQETVAVEVRSSRLSIETRRGAYLVPILHVDLAARADGAPAIRRQMELPIDELGLGFGLLARFAPGATLSLPQTNGRPTELFLTPAAAREPLGFAVGMMFLAGFCGFFLLALWATCGPEIRGRAAVHRPSTAGWLIFFSVGLFALTAGVGTGAYRSWQANFWPLALGKRVEAPADSLPWARVDVSEAARERVAATPVAWTEVEHEGRVYRLPAAACLAEPCVLLLNPSDPEDWTPPVDGNDDAWTPTWIGLVFGTVFTGAGWFIRKTGM